MNIHGWRQLAEWSIEFSCLNEQDKERAMQIFRDDWQEFCEWIDKEYGPHSDKLNSAL